MSWGRLGLPKGMRVPLKVGDLRSGVESNQDWLHRGIGEGTKWKFQGRLPEERQRTGDKSHIGKKHAHR